MTGKMGLLLGRARTNVQSAQLLLDSGDYDSCVSRAYYAMFYAAEAAMLAKGLAFSSHRSLISSFSLHFVKSGIFESEMGRNLNKAFDDRMASDYSPGPSADRQSADAALVRAEKFVQTVGDYLGREGQAQHGGR